MGKSTISMAIFNSFLYVYQRVPGIPYLGWWLLGLPHYYLVVANYRIPQRKGDAFFWSRIESYGLYNGACIYTLHN